MRFQITIFISLAESFSWSSYRYRKKKAVTFHTYNHRIKPSTLGGTKVSVWRSPTLPSGHQHVLARVHLQALLGAELVASTKSLPPCGCAHGSHLSVRAAGSNGGRRIAMEEQDKGGRRGRYTLLICLCTLGKVHAYLYLR